MKLKRHKNKLLLFCIVIASIPFLFVLATLVLGYEAYIVSSGSMAPSVDKGSVVLINTDVEQLEVSDIILFSFKGGHVLHRIQDQVVSGNNTMYTTQGDSNDTRDQNLTNESDIKGKYLFHIPFIGYISAWVQQNIITSFVIVFLLCFIFTKKDQRYEEA